MQTQDYPISQNSKHSCHNKLIFLKEPCIQIKQ